MKLGEKAIFIDTTLCTGCRTCQTACKEWNGLPAEKSVFFEASEMTAPKKLSALTWLYVRFFKAEVSEERSEWRFLPMMCYHCGEPPCEKSCPVNAIGRKDGWVLINNEECIGCGACAGTCPYGTVSLNEGKRNGPVREKKAYKCDGCFNRFQGKPACVNSCPTGAMTYGYRLKLLKEASKRLSEVKKSYPEAQLFGLKENSGMSVISLLKKDKKNYGIKKKQNKTALFRAEKAKALYSIVGRFSLGIPSLKRVIHDACRKLS